jgi:hypothetical protein
MSNTTFTIGGNTALGVPVGNTAQRTDSNPGFIRFNTDINNFEGYTDTWGEFGGGTANAAGVANALFGSGYIQYTGPDQVLTANINFIVGTTLPNPSGVNAPCFLLGSGVQNVWYITDQAYTTSNGGINVGMTAGETQVGSVKPGGAFLIYGGAASNGTGGQVGIYGGTSANGAAGDLYLGGGGSTTNAAGNVYIIGGQTGNQGGSVHLIGTNINNIPGYVYIKSNSTILYAFANTGALYIGGTNAGTPGQALLSNGTTNSMYLVIALMLL